MAQTIGSEGKPHVVGYTIYTVRKDGNDYPITGSRAADTTNWTRVDERTTDMVDKKGGKEVFRTRVVIAPDGQTKAVTTSGIDSKGIKYKISLIYRKQ